jgi:heptaprenyl diphosphate synthase
MPSVTEVTPQDRLIAGYAALAIVIHVLEAGFPSPVPGLKPGFANVITLIALVRHGWQVAVWVSVLRVLVGSLLVGSFLAPAFWLSASGACGSLLALGAGAAWNATVPVARLSVLGLSVLSAMAHMAAQFTLAYQLFIPHPGLLRLLPVLMLAALAFGALTGWAARQVLARLQAPPRLVSGER